MKYRKKYIQSTKEISKKKRSNEKGKKNKEENDKRNKKGMSNK